MISWYLSYKLILFFLLISTSPLTGAFYILYSLFLGQTNISLWVAVCVCVYV